MANNKIILGNVVLIDLTSDTVAADKLLQGYTAHNAAGQQITGTAAGGSTVTLDNYGTASATSVRYQRLTIDGTGYEIQGTKYMEQSVTLSTTANTNITFTNAAITTSSVIDVYCSIYDDISPASITLNNGSCVVSFYPHSTATTFTCRIYIK